MHYKLSNFPQVTYVVHDGTHAVPVLTINYQVLLPLPIKKVLKGGTRACLKGTIGKKSFDITILMSLAAQ